MILAAIGIRAGMLAGIFQQPAAVGFTRITEAAHPETASVVTFAAMFISVLFFENLLLGTFNLLPVPPLDGSTGITVLMSERTALRSWNSSAIQRSAWPASSQPGSSSTNCSIRSSRLH